MLKSLLRIPSPGSPAATFVKSESYSYIPNNKQNPKFETASSVVGNFSLKYVDHKNCVYPLYTIPPSIKRLSQFPLLQISSFILNQSQPRRSYSTESLFRLNETNSGLLQPVLDIENIFRNEILFQNSVSKRKLNRKRVSIVKELYSKALEAKQVRDQIQLQRDDTTNRVQELVRSEKDKEIKAEEMKTLKENGRKLREQLRESDAKFNQFNDELVDYVLSLPNLLDPETPEAEATLLSQTTVPEGVKKWEFPEYTAIESPVGPGLLAEFPIGQSAWLDVHLREKAQTHLLKGGFVETGNAEYVKRIILQGAGIDPSQFLRIREVK